MPTPSKCPRCGSPLNVNMPGGSCLACLLSFALKVNVESFAESVDENDVSLSPSLDSDEFTNYRILEKLGEGGCGVVYRAEQLRPVQREVAVKVIKLGMDTRNVIARFEIERQALALMDHPGIARVFDAGSTRTGRPFFAMELVRGERITDYCDHHHLSIAQRLELFARVCEAVQHAHQKGIIHRDLKPSNVLVTEIDGQPQPRIIDFGVAKATAQQRLAGQTIYTAFDQFVGTPSYMSPEQAGLTGEDVDTRSDIYSLGVLLYELLIGRPPFDPEQLRRAALNEICRIICEQEPVRPSAQLTSIGGEKLTEIASLRSAAPAKVLRELRGDLDWIVMRTLEKDRTRRYETAIGLAQDIQRHLKNEPVEARSPSAIYRFRKLLKRNKLAVIATTAVMIALVVGTLVSTWRFLLEKQARQRAVVAETNATAQARRSDQVARLLKETLASAGPSVALGRDTTMLREILDRTAERIGNELRNDPEIEAELQQTIGRAYSDLRELDKAEAMHRAVLRQRQSLFAKTNSAVIDAMMDLAGMLHSRAGSKDLVEAESLLRPVLIMRKQALGSAHLEVAQALEQLAANLRLQRKPNEPELLYREALAIRMQLQGAESPGLISCLESLAGLLIDDPQRLPEAESYIRRAYAIQNRLPNREIPSRIETLAFVGIVLRACGKPDEAETVMREAIALRRKIYGHEHETLSPALSTLAISLSDQGKSREAEVVIREAIALQKKYRGDEHPYLANFLLGTLVKILQDQQKWAEAETVGRELVPLLKKVSPHRLLARLDALHLLSIAHLRQEHWAEAEQALRESVTLCEQPLESGRLSSPTRCARLKRMLGEALLRQNKYVEAETFLLTAYETLRESTGKLELADFERSMVQLAQLYEATRQPARSTEWKQKLIEFQKSRSETREVAPNP